MSFADDMRIMSNINCTLASLVSYGEQRQNGASVGSAGTSFFGNMFNGFIRNDIAYGMQRFGNPSGNLINAYAGYGNPMSNAIGTMGLFTANVSPWMCFNMCTPMPFMPMSFNYFC